MQDRAFDAFPVLLAFAAWLAGTVLAGAIPGPLADLARFVVPGAALAWATRRLARDSPMARIGAWLLLFSALAFAAQGLFALDPDDPDAASTRALALAWTLWWIAFAPGALMQGLSRGRGLAAASALAVVFVCAPALLPVPRGALAFAQGVAVLVWFAWWFFAAARLPAFSRGATSARGWSRRAGR